MNFKFKNWKKFRDLMTSQSLELVKFDFKYHSCEFRMIYGMAQNVFIIGVEGTQKGFILNLNGYEVLNKLEKPLYKELASCKGEAFDPKKPYNPLDFLLEFDKYLGTSIPFVIPTKSTFGSTSSRAIPDELKIFFMKWMPHPIKGKVSQDNLKKIEKLLGYNIRRFCETNNISVGFQQTPSDRSLDVAKDFKADYKKYKGSEIN